MPKISLIILFVAALALAFFLGWTFGRRALEREWGNPVSVITPADVQRASVEGADPTPAAGTRVLRSLPLRRMRQAIKSFTEKDPVVVKLVSFARDDDDKEVHLVLANRGDCKAQRVAGVAYGYHARGNASAVGGGGAPYLAFDVKELKLDPGATGQGAMKIHDPGLASLGVAHVDLVECEGGKTWRR